MSCQLGLDQVSILTYATEILVEADAAHLDTAAGSRHRRLGHFLRRDSHLGCLRDREEVTFERALRTEPYILVSTN